MRINPTGFVGRTLKAIEKSRIIQRYEDWAIKDDGKSFAKLEKMYPLIFPTVYMLVQAAYIYKSDEMPKERRIPLALNNIINCIISFSGGLLMMTKHYNNFMKKMSERAAVIYKSENEKTLVKGMKIAVPFIVATMLYKYAGPVIATPLADKANKFLVKKGWVDYSK